MKSQDQPTKNGYWWLKDDLCEDLQIVKVYWVGDQYPGPCVSFIGTSNDGDLINTTGKWYGPITPPEED